MIPTEPNPWHQTALGEGGLLIRAEALGPLANRYALRLAEALLAQALPGLHTAVPAVDSVLLTFDPLILPREVLSVTVDRLLAHLEPAPAAPTRVITLPVRYGGADGPDLPELAATLGLTPAEVIGLLRDTVLRVLMIGFAPGFPYMGPVPPALQIPRRATPRTAVPAGSVALAAGMAGIYPARLPGGWHLIGRTSTILFDPTADPPSLLAPGDGVRLVPT